MTIAVSVLLGIIATYIVILLGYYLFQEKLIFIPVHRKDKREIQLVRTFKEMYFETANEGSIHGILIETRLEEVRGLIFYLHGNTGAMQRWAHMGQELSEFGFDVFIMYYRGYGKSIGPRRESWMRSDCSEVYRELINEVGENYKKIVVYGRSLGSGFAIPLAADVQPDKLVLETPFKSLLSVAKHHTKFLPLKFLLRYYMRSDLIIHRIACPVIIFHGTKDKIVPFSSAFELFQGVPVDDQNRFVSIPDGKHNNLSTYPAFRDNLRSFLLE